MPASLRRTATTHWTKADVARIAVPTPCAPLIAPSPPLIDGIDLWDYWPIQHVDGRPVEVAGGIPFLALSAPWHPDPDARHAVARIRLLQRKAGHWRDLGPLLPAELSPGSREWSGSAVLSPDGLVTLYYTAAGVRGEMVPTFGQRLFKTAARMVSAGDGIAFTNWSEPREFLVADGYHYQRDMTGGGAVGTIKAFRDPAYFQDPADSSEYILFAASLARSVSAWNGAVGLARCTVRGSWELLPPLIDADGVNNEMERPHVVVHQGRYYLFWSTQAKVFADSVAGPTGLYGMVSDGIQDSWRPLNTSGLVFANPAAAPAQAYSWMVLPDLTVLSFADLVDLPRDPMTMAERRAHFGGTPAPDLRLAIEGDRAWLI